MNAPAAFSSKLVRFVIFTQLASRRLFDPLHSFFFHYVMMPLLSDDCAVTHAICAFERHGNWPIY